MNLYQLLYVEINIISIIVLAVICVHIYRNNRDVTIKALFRILLNTIIAIMVVDCLWVMIDGHLFPLSIPINKFLNAAYLSISAYIPYIWLMYILQQFGHKCTKREAFFIGIPAVLLTLLCVLSIWTGWLIQVNELNKYQRGPYHWTQVLIANGYLALSLIPVISELFHGENAYVTRPFLYKILSFYIMPIIGTIITTYNTKIPAVWPLTSLSLLIIYVGLQENAIETDGLTGLSNRKTLSDSFNEQCRSLTEHQKLYLFILDLNRFRQINDTYGHSVGDDALVKTAEIIRNAISGTSYYAARYGGGEFIIIARFNSRDDAISFAYNVRKGIAETNENPEQHYRLDVAIGYDVWDNEESLSDLIESAETLMYKDKAAITW